MKTFCECLMAVLLVISAVTWVALDLTIKRNQAAANDRIEAALATLHERQFEMGRRVMELEQRAGIVRGAVSKLPPLRFEDIQAAPRLPAFMPIGELHDDPAFKAK